MKTNKCECDYTGQLVASIANLYDPDSELPFVAHLPGECRCRNNLNRFERDGKIVWLCSCCHTSNDRFVSAR